MAPNDQLIIGGVILLAVIAMGGGGGGGDGGEETVFRWQKPPPDLVYIERPFYEERKSEEEDDDPMEDPPKKPQGGEGFDKNKKAVAGLTPVQEGMMLSYLQDRKKGRQALAEDYRRIIQRFDNFWRLVGADQQNTWFFPATEQYAQAIAQEMTTWTQKSRDYLAKFNLTRSSPEGNEIYGFIYYIEGLWENLNRLLQVSAHQKSTASNKAMAGELRKEMDRLLEEHRRLTFEHQQAVAMARDYPTVEPGSEEMDEDIKNDFSPGGIDVQGDGQIRLTYPTARGNHGHQHRDDFTGKQSDDTIVDPQKAEAMRRSVGLVQAPGSMNDMGNYAGDDIYDPKKPTARPGASTLEHPSLDDPDLGKKKKRKRTDEAILKDIGSSFDMDAHSESAWLLLQHLKATNEDVWDLDPRTVADLMLQKSIGQKRGVEGEETEFSGPTKGHHIHTLDELETSTTDFKPVYRNEPQSIKDGFNSGGKATSCVTLKISRQKKNLQSINQYD